MRDASQPDFGAEYYLPTEEGDEFLCRRCGTLSSSMPDCGCGAAIRVTKCEAHKDNPDQLKECAACGYQRGGVGDPVQEIVHGSDGPNTVIATALSRTVARRQAQDSGVRRQPPGGGVLCLVCRGVLPEIARSQSDVAGHQGLRPSRRKAFRSRICQAG